HHLRGHILRPLRGVHRPDPVDRLQQGRPHLRVKLPLRGGQRLDGHPQLLEPYTVETFGGLLKSGEAPLADRLHYGSDTVNRGSDINLGAGQQTPRVTRATTQVDPVQHSCESMPPCGWPTAGLSARDGESDHARLDKVTSRLPMFPLNTVLFPGLVLPLHVFEDRYRALVRDLVSLPEDTPREFGVVALQRGWETQ